VLVDELARIHRAEHELANEERVAAAGVPNLGDGGCLDRIPQHEMEQGVHGRAIEIDEIDATDTPAMPQ
jgi:hypothetical protein